MPNIIVNGFDSSADKKKLLDFQNALEYRCLKIEDLDVKSRQFVFINTSLLPVDKNSKIVIVAFIRRRGKRTDETFKQVANELAEVTKIYFPERPVTCYVRPHEKEMGFAVKK